MTVVLLTLAASVAACGSDAPATAGEDDGEGGHDAGAAGAPAVDGGGGAPDAAGSGSSEQPQGAAGGAKPGESGGEGGRGEEQLPTFEPYSFDLLVVDYYGDEGLFRLTLSDTGASEPEVLFSVSAGERTLWQRLDGDGVIFTVQDDTYGHLYRQPLAGGDAERITHELAEHEIVEKWATVGDDVYYGVGTFEGNSHSYPRALWKASPSDGGYTRTQIALPEPREFRFLYDVWSVGDWLYLPGSAGNSGGEYELHRATPPDSALVPVRLSDYRFNLHRAGDVLTYSGTNEAAGVGIYAAKLNQSAPSGVRLSPNNVPIGNNPNLDAGSRHYFFSTKVDGEGEKGYYADLSREPFKVVPLLESEDPAAQLYGVWSSKGRYFFLHEGQAPADLTVHVVDVTEEQPAPRLVSKRLDAGWLSSSPDERLFSMTQPELWIMKPGDGDFELRVDDGLDLDGATVSYSMFSSDGYHVWFALSDGRSFVDDTLASTPPNPVEVTPDLPDGWTATHASQVPHGGFLLAVSTDDVEAKATRKDRALYYLRRLPSGEYAPAERVDIAGTRYVVTLD